MTTVRGGSFPGARLQVGMLLFSLAFALAQPRYDPCADLGALVSSGLPDEVVVSTIREMQPALTEDDLSCIAKHEPTAAALAELTLRVVPAASAPSEPVALPSADATLARPVVGGNCFPPCSPGYLCHESKCIQACNPSCESGFRCNADRICESLGVPTSAASPGVGKVCVVRGPGPMNKWTVDLDGGRVGVVGSDRHVCFLSEAGRRSIRVIQTIGGAGWAVSSLSNSATPETTLNIEVDRGSDVGILCNAVIGIAATRIDCGRIPESRLPAYLSGTEAE